jgi:ABC-type phosphate transport system permease subunit
MENIFIGTVLISPFLLLATYILTAKTKSFKKIFLVHTCVLVVYMTIILNYSKILTGHDEYGLGQFSLVITCIVIHIIIGFFHALYLHHKIKKSYMTDATRILNDLKTHK